MKATLEWCVGRQLELKHRTRVAELPLAKAVELIHRRRLAGPAQDRALYMILALHVASTQVRMTYLVLR